MKVSQGSAAMSLRCCGQRRIQSVALGGGRGNSPISLPAFLLSLPTPLPHPLPFPLPSLLHALDAPLLAALDAASPLGGGPGV